MGLLSQATNGSVLSGLGGDSVHGSHAHFGHTDRCQESENLNQGFLRKTAIWGENPLRAKREGPPEHPAAEFLQD